MLDDSLQLMDGQTLTETGDGETVLDLGEGYAPQPDQPTRLELNIDTLDYTTEDETYVVEVKESDDNSTFTSTGLIIGVTAIGQISKVFSSVKRYVKLVWTLAGTTPSIKASAWLNQAA